VVLSYDYWTSRFAADPAIVGRAIRINRLPYTVIASRRADSAHRALLPPDVWVPMMMQAQIEIGNACSRTGRPRTRGS